MNLIPHQNAIGFDFKLGDFDYSTGGQFHQLSPRIQFEAFLGFKVGVQCARFQVV